MKRKKDLKKLNYGIIHSQLGLSDGVSIVMRQVEDVMVKNLKIPKSKIFYLVGKCKKKSSHIKQSKVLWHKHPTNIIVSKHYDKGFGGALSEKIENAIRKAKEDIKKFINDKNIDVIIDHNSSHPVNFIGAIALSRFYRDQIKAGKKTPKYIVWWHDSHFERERYANPSRDIKNYLLEGVPGKYVDYIIFINNLQFESAQNYFKELDSRNPGTYDRLLRNHTVIYNTADTIIQSYSDLNFEKFGKRAEKFLEEYKIKKLLKKHKLTLKDVQFVLQHTRIIPRKRIDFALKYSYKLFSKLKEKRLYKGMIFFISGPSGNELGDYKLELKKLNSRLAKQYKTDKFFLVFAEDFKKNSISFEEMPIIFSKLGAISTYFSEVEGFGNNLLEVLAAGLIPAVYTYPVFVKDIARYKFKIVCLDRFEITNKSINEMIKVIQSDRIKKKWANTNIKILKKKFSHETIAPKLARAIIKGKRLNNYIY